MGANYHASAHSAARPISPADCRSRRAAAVQLITNDNERCCRKRREICCSGATSRDRCTLQELWGQAASVTLDCTKQHHRRIQRQQMRSPDRHPTRRVASVPYSEQASEWDNIRYRRLSPRVNIYTHCSLQVSNRCVL